MSKSLRKANRQLEARIKEWEKSTSSSRYPQGAFTKPGSMKKKSL